MTPDLPINTIHLHGDLREDFGGPFTLAVGTPVEAISALCRLLPGFQARLNGDGIYRVIRGPEQGGMDLDKDELSMRLPGEMHLVPVPAGAGGGGGNGTAKTIAGVALIAVAAYMTFGVGAGAIGASLGAGAAASPAAIAVGTQVIGFTAAMGLSLTMTGVSMMLSPQPRSGNVGADPNASYLFYGNMNVTDQGVPVPLVFGRVRTGSIIISSGLDVDEAPPAPTVPDSGPDAGSESGSTGSNNGVAIDPYNPTAGLPDP